MKVFRRNKYFLKVVAIFIAFNLMLNIFFPVASFALTSGPLMPEYTGFEPVDTSDMVNLATGDLTYNLPILEVPGPEGGYPMSLAYHAGHVTEQEASWVGLGWSLNPGAISRLVSMHPDDMLNQNIDITDDHVGGRTDFYGVGVSYLGVGSVGLTFAHDTYKGNGIGAYASLGPQINMGGGSAGVGLDASIGPYGGGSVGVSASIGYTFLGSKLGVGMEMGVAYQFSASGDDPGIVGTQSVGLSYGKSSIPVLGVSISTDGNKPSYSAGGVSFGGQNDHSNNFVSESQFYAIPIPNPFDPQMIFTIGWGHTKYYMHSVDGNLHYGSLYFQNLDDSNPDFKNISLDCIAFKNPLDPLPAKNDVDVIYGGAMPAYDSYMISAQGVGGSMKPYIYEYGSVFRKREQSTDNKVNFKTSRTYSGKVGFKITGGFANSFERTSTSAISAIPTGTDDYAYKYGYNRKNDITINDIYSDGFNPNRGTFANKQHVDFFTVAEVADGTAEAKGLVGKHAGQGFVTALAANTMDHGIGAYKVTNASGVTYHYTIPVYNYNNVTKVGDVYDIAKRTISNPVPYAYSWLLTGITGPDFVDSGRLSGEIDDDDKGYWVKFEYGKWTDVYNWRSPHTQNLDAVDDPENKMYNGGTKEVYYLNSISTRTHTALFVKSIRDDAKGVAETEHGGFSPITFSGKVIASPNALLKLDKVLLFTNRVLKKKLQELASISTPQELGNVSSVSNPELHDLATTIDYPIQYWNNVIDDADINNGTPLSTIQLWAEKQIIFKYTYDNFKTVPNCKNIDYSTHTVNSSANSGKLTLTEVETLARNAKKVVPSTKFEYYSSTYNNEYSLWGYSGKPVSSLGQFGNRVNYGSLKRVKMSNGFQMDIEYESDVINSIKIGNKVPLKPKRVNQVSQTGDEVEIEFEDYSYLSSVDLTNFSLNFFFYYKELCPVSGKVEEYEIETLNNVSATDMGNGILRFHNQAFHDLLANGKNFQCPLGTNLTIRPQRIAGVAIFDFKSSLAIEQSGIRVKSITNSADGFVSKSEMIYENGDLPYWPVKPINVRMTVGQSGYMDLIGDPIMKDYHDIIVSIAMNAYDDVIPNASFLPPPLVLYQKTTVKDYSKPNGASAFDLLGSKVFEFNTFDHLNPRVINSSLNIAGTTKSLQEFYDYRSEIGYLKKVAQFDASGNILSETSYGYLNEDVNFEAKLASDYRNQGRYDQVFYEKKEYRPSTTSPVETHIGVTSIKEFPIVPTSVTFKNYKNGLTTQTDNVSFDYYTGDVLISKSSDAYQNEFYSVNIPAYYVYPDMGHGINDGSKHMLSQSAGSYSFKVKGVSGATFSYPNPASFANPGTITDYMSVGLVSAGVTTWTNSLGELDFGNNVGVTYPTNVWRNEASYSWVGDVYDLSKTNGIDDSFTDYFNFSIPSVNIADDKWLLTGKNELVSPYSHLVQVSDINNNKQCTVYDPTNSLVTAVAANANINEVAYSGCEFNEYYNTITDGEGFVVKGTQSVIVYDPLRAHTGNYALETSRGTDINQYEGVGFSYTLHAKANKVYRASVWVYLPGTAETGSIDNAKLVCKNTSGTVIKSAVRDVKKKAGSYYLIDMDFSVSSDQVLTISAVNNNADRAIYFDDFRVHPLKAVFSSNVYDLDRQLVTHVLDDDNMYTRFVYDDNKRVVATYREQFRQVEHKVSEQRYNFSK